MKVCPLIMLIFLLLGVVSVPVCAQIPGRTGYVTIESVDIGLTDDYAVIDLSYHIDDIVSILVLLLGKRDLKNRLNKTLNFKDARFIETDMDHARILVRGVSIDYGDNSYWFPEHEFDITLANVTVITPQFSRTYNETTMIPNGIGFFRGGLEPRFNFPNNLTVISHLESTAPS